MQALLKPVRDFLQCATPDAWVEAALEQPDMLLIDHMNCEKKAASTAMSLIHRYPARRELLVKMARLAREELSHFVQVLKITEARGIPYTHVSASRYAAGLLRHTRSQEPGALVDRLIVGAYIEARSCERFARIAPRLDDELSAFYTSLLKSEARHFQDYLELARLYAGEPIDARIAVLGEIERELIESPDPQLRFHSGVPVG